MLSLMHRDGDPPDGVGVRPVEVVGVAKVRNLFTLVTLLGVVEDVESMVADSSFSPDLRDKEGTVKVGGDGDMVTRVMVLDMSTGARSMLTYCGNPVVAVAIKDLTVFLFVLVNAGLSSFTFKVNGKVLAMLSDGALTTSVLARPVRLSEDIGTIRVGDRVCMINRKGELVSNFWVDTSGAAHQGKNTKAIMTQSGSHAMVGGPVPKKVKKGKKRK